ncbi:MAG TPA: S8 family peptidase [Roseiflexaceae bacterium]|nr:S8 family peptidase [Roseiflexaceae bacterium]
MKRLVGLLVFALVLVSFGMASPAAAGNTAAAPAAKGPRFIDGQYIVTLKPGISAKAFAKGSGIATKYVYDKAVNGFTAKLTLNQVAALKRNPNIATIEQDQVMALVATQSGATWGLDRIDQRNLPLSGTYNYVSTASTVNAYVIDTGIQTSHPQFGGRAAVAYDALGGNGQDCQGHGTHVAGTIGSSTYGVAKGVRLWSVRVLGCDGSGSTSGIINALNWLATNHRKPAVANMSLGGGYSAALNSATTNMINAGVFLAVAAGNENQNACNVSPASASGTLTVAASDRTDTRASFSNYGGCVDIYAPGVSITSTWLSGGTNTISGTSMASPHAAGVGALYKATYGDASASTIVSWIINNSTPNVIKNNPAGTPNRLLYKAGL